MIGGMFDDARDVSPPARARSRRAVFTILGQQRRFVYLAVVLLTVAGIWSALQLPSAIYPELEFSRVTVVVNGTALGARQVLFSITRPVEEAISIVPGVMRVQSRSIRGGSETNVTFAPSRRGPTWSTRCSRCGRA
jgi:multidrug efflux pump subunit AcrB